MKPLSVYVDQCMWPLLYKRKLEGKPSLCVELPPSDWRLLLARESELEISQQKSGLEKAFIKGTIKECGIKVHAFFGFSDLGAPNKNLRVAGFGEMGREDVGGHWAEKEQCQLMRWLQEKHFGKDFKLYRDKRKESLILYKMEADISLAVRSIRDVVITRDGRRGGPLKSVRKWGLNVVLFTDSDNPSSLSEFIGLKLREQAALKSSLGVPPWESASRG